VQFSLLGADAADPTVGDIAGVMLAGGQWVQHSTSARLSVVVRPGWREPALLEEFQRRELPAEGVDAVGGLRAVRTDFRSALLSEARRWRRGSGATMPDDLALTAAGLRLWTIVAGVGDAHGYLLGMRAADAVLHRQAGSQLARLGISAVKAGRVPGWRVVGQRRLRWLAELIGPPPPGAAAAWPA
jgi:hypothetical protein